MPVKTACPSRPQRRPPPVPRSMRPDRHAADEAGEPRRKGAPPSSSCRRVSDTIGTNERSANPSASVHSPGRCLRSAAAPCIVVASHANRKASGARRSRRRTHRQASVGQRCDAAAEAARWGGVGGHRETGVSWSREPRGRASPGVGSAAREFARPLQKQCIISRIMSNDKLAVEFEVLVVGGHLGGTYTGRTKP